MKHNKTKPELTVLFKYPIYNINCSYFCLLTKCIRRSIRNTDSGFSCSLFYRFRLFMFLVLQIPTFHVPGFTDSGFSCSWFYRFRLFMFRVFSFLVPFPDSPFLVLQIAFAASRCLSKIASRNRTSGILQRKLTRL